MALVGSTLRFETSQVLKNLRRLKSRFPKANARALNRANVSARTFMVKHVASDMGLKSGDVKAELVTREATEAKLSASLEVKGTRIPLIKFAARGPVPSRGRGRGVTARMPGGAGRYPNAFIATMSSGHIGVFQRRRRARLPIYELRGPSLPLVFAKFIPQGLAIGEAALITNLRSELKFALSQSA
jgi:hypothetical protein